MIHTKLGFTLLAFWLGISTSLGSVEDFLENPPKLIHQRIHTFEALKIRGSTPAGRFSANISLQTDHQGSFVSLKVDSDVKGAFEDLEKAGIHISRTLGAPELQDGLSMIEIKDLKHNGTRIPISGTLLHAKLKDFSQKTGGKLVLTYKSNMITKSEDSITLSIRSKLLEIEGSKPVAHSRFWYVADKKGAPIDELNIQSNEWDIVFVGRVPVGVESIEIGYINSLETEIEMFQDREMRMIQREQTLSRAKDNQKLVRYLKMTVIYYDKILSKLPKDDPSREEIERNKQMTVEMLEDLEEQLKNRSKN